ncbi:MAG: MipA family protein [Nevskia sp.]|nr:MipA family protein [Nevskia sp.]
MEKRSRGTTGAIALITALAWCPLTSWAQGALSNSEEEDRNRLDSRSAWDFTLGAGAVAEPRYEGSKHYILNPIPYVAIRYDDLVSIGVDGIRWNVIHSNGLHVGPLLSYSGGRSTGDDELLQNLDNIQSSINAGAFATYKLGHFEFLAQAQQAVLHEHNGLFGKIGMTYQEPFRLFGRKALLETGPQIEFANRQYENTWFGITPAESLRSGLREFSPGAGVKDVGLQTSLTLQYSPHILLRGIVNVKELVGDAADSPLTTGKTQFFVGLGIGYKF